MRKLSKDHTPLTPVSAPDEGTKARLLTLGDLDNRTRAFRNAQTIIAEMTSDLGGTLSAAQRVLCGRAAVATVVVESMEATWLAGKEIDLGAYNMTVNSLSRLLRILGLERRQRDVTPQDLSSYISGQRGKNDAPHQPPRPPRPPSTEKANAARRKAQREADELEGQLQIVLPPVPPSR